MRRMLVHINQQTVEAKEGVSLRALLLENTFYELRGIAVAINDMVIPKTDWDNTIIQNNDRILIITATAGG